MKSPSELVVDTILAHLQKEGVLDVDVLGLDDRQDLHGKLVTDVAAIVPTLAEWETIETLTRMATPGGLSFIAPDQPQIDWVADCAKRVITLCRKTK